MNLYSIRDYLLITGLLILGLIGGLLFGQVGWGLFAALCVWFALQHVEYAALRRWSQRPLSRPSFRTDAWQSAAVDLNRSARRQRERTNNALRQLRQLRTVTQALPDAAIILDASGRIESANPAAAALLGVRPQDAGVPLVEIVRHPKVVILLRMEDLNDPVEIPSPRDENTLVEMRLVPVGEDQTLVLGRNVTQLNRLLSMRQDFVANVSHELKTPLTVILGYLEALGDDDLSTEEADLLIRKLVPPAQRLDALVQDLLLLTRLESSPNLTEEDLVPVAMGSMFNNVVAALEGVSQGRHTFVHEVTSDAQIFGVAHELESAVTNLVSNAIRYSPEGGTIRLSWRDCASGVELSVEDEGMGIGAEHLSRLTERFYRVDLARARVQGGTGLGLAIVKHVLKRHKTNLMIESELGKGSRFYCRFDPSQLKRQSQQKLRKDV